MIYAADDKYPVWICVRCIYYIDGVLRAFYDRNRWYKRGGIL